MKSHQIKKTKTEKCQRICSPSKPLIYLMLEVVIGLQLIAIFNYVITSIFLLIIILIIFLIKPIRRFLIVRNRPCTKINRTKRRRGV